MCQDHLVLSLPLSWSQLLLQGSLICFCGEYHLKSSLWILYVLKGAEIQIFPCLPGRHNCEVCLSEHRGAHLYLCLFQYLPLHIKNNEFTLLPSTLTKHDRVHSSLQLSNFPHLYFLSLTLRNLCPCSLVHLLICSFFLNGANVDDHCKTINLLGNPTCRPPLLPCSVTLTIEGRCFGILKIWLQLRLSEQLFVAWSLIKFSRDLELNLQSFLPQIYLFMYCYNEVHESLLSEIVFLPIFPKFKFFEV